MGEAMNVLQEASKIIYGDREKTYGHPSANLDRIATMWSVVFGHPVTLEQVCMAMVALKLARLVNEPGHSDSWVDIAGYSALPERCKEGKTAPTGKYAPAACVCAEAIPSEQEPE